MKQNYKLNYDLHARRQCPSDLFAQVRRTIGGKAVSSDQILLIIDAIHGGLALEESDVVLELACGNGLLSHHLFARCSGYLGVDISPFLVAVAQTHFAQAPKYDFVASEVLDFLGSHPNPKRYTKALIYAAIQYFTNDEVTQILKELAGKYHNICQVFLGNIPDQRRINNFYGDQPSPPLRDRGPNSAIGIWRSEGDLQILASEAGWEAKCSQMPSEFYAANYRFDVVLTRSSRVK